MRFYKVGSKCLVLKPCYITPNCISLGNNVSIFNSARIEGVFKYNHKKFDPKIYIGNNVTVQQNVHITCADSIFIDDYVAIASNVTITDIIHPYENIDIPIENQNIIYNSVNIGFGTKIYNNSVILPGVSIGKHCVIGANSVVNISIPDYSVACGSPAKIIKKYSFELSKWIGVNEKT